MLKRILAVVILIIISLNFSACSTIKYTFDELFLKNNSNFFVFEKVTPKYINPKDDLKNLSYTTVKKYSVIPSEYYDYIAENCAYEKLNSKYKSVYKKILDDVYNISTEKDNSGKYLITRVKTVDIKISERDLMMIIESIKFDHPEIFWIDTIFGYYYKDNNTYIQMYSFASPVDLQDKIRTLTEKITDIIKNIAGGLSEYDREKLLHDIILDLCSYDENVKTVNDGWEAFSSYGALCRGKAVCSGYANAFQLLTSYVGIHTHKTVGVGNSDLHMWNTAKIDGIWYNVDLTWNDADDEFNRYRYFNVNDEIILKTHSISKLYSEITDDEISDSENISFNLLIQKCDSMEANYYVKESPLIKDFSAENDIIVVAYLVSAINNGNKIFTVRIDDSLDFTDVVNKLFYNEPYKFFDYIEKANMALSTPYENTKIKFFKDAEQNLVHIVLFN